LAEPEEKLPVAKPVSRPQPRPTPVPVPKAIPVARPAAGTGTSLRIVYRPDGAILDSTVEVFLDGRLVGKGRVLGGFDVSVPATVGVHQLELKLLFRQRSYSLQLPRQGAYEVRLYYDRLWNNFSDRIDVRHLG